MNDSIRSSRLLSIARGLSVILIALLVWELASRTGAVSRVFLPGPVAVLGRLLQLLSNASFYGDVGLTLYRFFLGFVVGTAIGIPLGIAMGLSRALHSALGPLVEFLRPIPASALVPVAILFLGFGNRMVLAIVALAVLWPVLINTISGVRSVDPLLLDTGRVFRLTRLQLVWKVVLPASLPGIFTGMRISLAVSLVLVVVVEMLVAQGGLGSRVIDAERTFHVSEMYATIATLGVLGFLINGLFVTAARAFVGWHGYMRERGHS